MKTKSYIQGIMDEKNRLFEQNQFLSHLRDQVLSHFMIRKLEENV